MYELDGDYMISDKSDIIDIPEDIGVGGAAAGATVGAFIGAAVGYVATGYAGYKLGEYINEEYLPNAGTAVHFAVDGMSIVVTEGIIGSYVASLGAAGGAVIGGALGGLLTDE